VTNSSGSNLILPTSFVCLNEKVYCNNLYQELMDIQTDNIGLSYHVAFVDVLLFSFVYVAIGIVLCAYLLDLRQRLHLQYESLQTLSKN